MLLDSLLTLCLFFLTPILATGNSSAAVFTYTPATKFQYVFALSADNVTNDLYLYLSGPSTDAWIGFGIGSRMADSLVFIAYLASDGQTVTLSPRIAGDHVEPAHTDQVSCAPVDPQTGIDPNTNNMFGSWRCKNAIKVSGLRLDANANPKQPFIFAIGPPGFGMNSDDLAAPLRRHDFYGQFTMDMTKAFQKNAVAPVPNGPQSSWESQNASEAFDTTSQSNRASVAHAFVMCAVFILVFPFGSLVLRLKDFVIAHAVVQMFGTLLVLVGFGLGVSMSKLYIRSKSYNSVHQILGLVIFAGVMGQIALGIFGRRMNKKMKKRTTLSWVHFILGPSLIVLGIANGGLGFKFAGNPLNILQYYICVVVAVFLLYFAARATLLCLARRRKHREAPESDEGGYQYPKFGEESPQEIPLQSYPVQNSHCYFPPPPTR